MGNLHFWKRLNRQGYSEDSIDKIAMKDTFRNSHLSLPLITTFEVGLVIFWIYNRINDMFYSSYLYLLGYLSLIVVSLAVYAYICYCMKNYDVKYHAIMWTQNFYVAFLFVWAVYFTYLDAVSFNSFSPLIFMTISCIAPIFSYMRPRLWALFILMAAISMDVLAYLYSGEAVIFVINFSVYVIISCFAQIALYDLRHNSYVRQLELKDLADENYEFAYRDALTGLLNRHSYSETIEELHQVDVPSNLVVLSFDANDLKGTNDTKGHRVGDELIVGAANCVRSAFGDYGNIFRTGGDEFFGIVTLTKEQLQEALHSFATYTKEWKGEHINGLSISVGFACKSDYPDATLDTLFIEAENAMYLDKARYYSESGKERRH